MSEFERARAAHRAVFAAMTIAISADDADIETILAEYALDTPNPAQSFADIARAAVWHAAGALFAYTRGDRQAALKLVQQGATAQEMKEEGRD